MFIEKRCSAKCVRGQVFYYNPIWAVLGKERSPEDNRESSRLENKTRPYLVISNDDGNYSSSICNLIPITTREEIRLPCQVKFLHVGRPQVILTEQIFTANIMDLGNYLYTVNDYILGQVEAGLSIQFNIRSDDFEETMASFVTRMNGIVDRLVEDGKKKLLVASRKQMEEVALLICESVEVLLESSTTMSDADEVKENIICKDNVISVHEDCKDTVIDETKVCSNEELCKTSPSKSRIRWNTSMNHEFMNDCESMGTGDLMLKYNLSSKRAVSDRKYILKKSMKDK